eukprot:755168-Hanusia_phi.AAC.5
MPASAFNSRLSSSRRLQHPRIDSDGRVVCPCCFEDGDQLGAAEPVDGRADEEAVALVGDLVEDVGEGLLAGEHLPDDQRAREHVCLARHHLLRLKLRGRVPLVALCLQARRAQALDLD